MFRYNLLLFSVHGCVCTHRHKDTLYGATEEASTSAVRYLNASTGTCSSVNENFLFCNSVTNHQRASPVHMYVLQKPNWAPTNWRRSVPHPAWQKFSTPESAISSTRRSTGLLEGPEWSAPLHPYTLDTQTQKVANRICCCEWRCSHWMQATSKDVRKFACLCYSVRHRLVVDVSGETEPSLFLVTLLFMSLCPTPDQNISPALGTITFCCCFFLLSKHVCSLLLI